MRSMQSKCDSNDNNCKYECYEWKTWIKNEPNVWFEYFSMKLTVIRFSRMQTVWVLDPMNGLKFSTRVESIIELQVRLKILALSVKTLLLDLSSIEDFFVVSIESSLFFDGVSEIKIEIEINSSMLSPKIAQFKARTGSGRHRYGRAVRWRALASSGERRWPSPQPSIAYCV